jgi:transcription antitermination factor NusG
MAKGEMATISANVLTSAVTLASALRATATSVEKIQESDGAVVAAPALAAEDDQLRWYAAYTSANHEKRVAEHFRVREVEHFLPTYCSVRRWKDRRVTLQLPLFPGYVFVRIALRDRLRVVQVPGLARLVGFNGMPAALPKEEIAALQATLASGVRAEPHPFLVVGRRVRVKSGPMTGMQGILLKRKGRFRVVISIELIQRAVALDADVADVEPLP